MNNFDWSDYEEPSANEVKATTIPEVAPVEEKKQPKEETKKEEAIPFDWGDYEEPSEKKKAEYPYKLQYAKYTPEEYEALSPEKKKELQEYQPLTSSVRLLLKGATLGATQVKGLRDIGAFGPVMYFLDKYYPLEVQKHEHGLGIEETLGETLPIIATGSLLSYPLKFIPEAYKYGSMAAQKAATFGTGAATEFIKEATEGEGFRPWDIAKTGAFFVGAETVFKLLAKKFFGPPKPPSAKQQMGEMASEALPENISEREYKYLQDVVVPEMETLAKQEYETALSKAVESNNAKHELNLRKAKADHESKMYKLAQEDEAAEALYKQRYQEELEALQKAQEDEIYEMIAKEQKSAEDVLAAREKYQTQLNKSRAEHENAMAEFEKKKAANQKKLDDYNKQYEEKVERINQEHAENSRKIEEANERVLQEYEESKAAFDEFKDRERVVNDALKSTQLEAEAPLQRKVTKGGERLGLEVEAPAPKNALSEKIGDVVSKERFPNTQTGGEELITAMRSNAKFDYERTKIAYKISDKLNEKVSGEHPELFEFVEKQLSNLEEIGVKTPVQEQQMRMWQKLRNTLVETDAKTGEVTGFKKVSNRDLQEQSKAMRYFMDFKYEFGNTRGSFSPTVQAIEDAIESAARTSGQQRASIANEHARSMYRQWVQEYDTPLIRKMRDTSQYKYSSIYKQSLNPDEFNKLSTVLNKSFSGAQVATKTKRSLVEKALSKFTKDPRKASLVEFNEALSELSSVLTEQEQNAIRQQFNQARKSGKHIKASKTIKPKEPKELEFEAAPVKKEVKYKPPRIEEPQPPSARVPQVPLPEQIKPQPIPELPEPKVKKPTPKISQVTEAKVPTKPEVVETPEMKVAAKKMKITPEEVRYMSSTPTGLKNLRKELAKSPKGEEIFEKIGKYRTQEILFKGKVKHTFKGSELAETLNKGDNYDLLSEIRGQQYVDELIEIAEKVGEKEVTRETIRKYAKKIGTLKAAVLLGII